MSPEWRMAVKNLARNKRRNAATGMAIALGFAALIALSGYLNRVQNYLRVYTIYGTRTGHIVVYKKDGLDHYSIKPWVYSLTKDDQTAIEKALAVTDNIDFFGATLQGTGLIGNGCKTVPFLATGLDPNLDEKLRKHPEMSRWAVNLSDYKKGTGLQGFPEELGAVALSEGLAKLLGKTKIHADFPPDAKPVIVSDCLAPDAKAKIDSDANVQLVAGAWSGTMSAQDGEVVANYNTGITETNNMALLASLPSLQKLYDTPNVTSYAIWLRNPERVNQTMQELKGHLGGGDFDVYPWEDERISPFYGGTMQFLYTMIGFISFVLATVIVFSISNSATMTIIERGQEIGMLRSLGYTRRVIRALFLREMSALTILSGGIGLVFGIGGVLFVNALKVHFHPPGVAGGMTLALKPAPWMVIASGVMIFVLASGAAWLATRQVVRRNITVLLMGSHR